MQAGRLRHEVSFQTPTPGVDAAGFPKETDGSATVLYCEVQPVKAGESFDGAGYQGTVTHLILTRADQGVTIDHSTVATYDGRTFRILGVRNLFERDRTLEIHAEERVGE